MNALLYNQQHSVEIISHKQGGIQYLVLDLSLLLSKKKKGFKQFVNFHKARPRHQHLHQMANPDSSSDNYDIWVTFESQRDT